MPLGLAALLVLLGLVGLPYLAARGLWRITMPSGVRLALILLVPTALILWLATSPDFADINSPGAALIPLAAVAGWLLGVTGGLRRRLVVRQASRN